MKTGREAFTYGWKRGIPIALGYIPVSFTFGFMAVSGGLPAWLVIFISLSNLTSAGQFAGTNLIIGGAGLVEIMLTTFVINIRYMLMSLSISQKIEPGMSLIKRMIFAFGITDETFSVASMESGRLSFSYLVGLILAPIAGWSLGTTMGALITKAMPDSLAMAMGIALYAMFIAIIIPPMKKSRPVVLVVGISVLVTCLLYYVPFFSFISSGFRVIMATVVAAAFGAGLFPAEEKEEKEDVRY